VLPIETVKAFYGALAKGDAQEAFALLNDPLEWTEAEGFPYFSGTWRSKEEIAEKLFVPLSKDWEGFSVNPDSFVTEGQEVVSFGIYRGINRKSARSLAAPFAHRWRVADGRIVRFVQYTDTLLVHKALR